MGKPEYDWDGRLIEGSGGMDYPCVVSPLSESRINATDIDGDSSKLQVLAPPGVKVLEGMTAVIRGMEYRVIHEPFDWSVGRRAINPSHIPRTRIIVERLEG